ncbi:HEAT repeat-containing protein [Cylindrospermum stagnale PCC 7417]|uniref:HEAT repeat-containing protein n=1 Tax=Cylindrospermum stagnale PCC 7417 TaxID=56107 RepID=K9WVW6_9NOST|nr:HEAT repeat domain-containing protein [Cylindrospermum stagnale]AFZ24520.1 HEAT repeat-containing protein [Cylindrospermum stagnale PCC 7417]
MSEEMATILKDLKDPNPRARIKALDTIGTMKPSNAIDLITPYLSDNHVRVRVASVWNLGDIRNINAIPHIIKAAKQDPSEEVRGVALAALENYQSPEILDCLVAEVYREKQSRRPRQEVAKQLQHYDFEEAVNALIILLHDEDVFVRDDAAESLLQLNRPRLVDVWKKSLEDLSDDVRNIAVTALTNLGFIEEAIDELVALLQDENFFMRDSLAECLLKLNRPRLREVWQKFLNDQEEDVRDIAIKALQELTDENLQ